MTNHNSDSNDLSRSPRSRRARRFRPNFAIGALTLFLAGVMLWLSVPAWAAPPPSALNQTVPLPTASPTRGRIPTATPTPDAGNEDDDDDDDEEESEDASGQTDPEEELDYAVEFDEPTVTPTPGGPATTVTETEGEAAADAAVVSPALPEAEYMGTVKLLVLNVRAGPDDAFPILGTVFQGDEVGLLGRNADNTWWLICCVFGRDIPGWVDAESIEPEFPVDEAVDLLSEVEMDATDEELREDATAQGDSALLLEMRQYPVFVWQGQQLELIYTLRNTSDVDAIDVELRNDFPAGLEYVETQIDEGAEITLQPGDDGDSVLAVTWPVLEAGAETAVYVVLQIADNLPDGTVLDNLAVVNAANADGMTDGITVSLPPAEPPDFQ